MNRIIKKQLCKSMIYSRFENSRQFRLDTNLQDIELIDTIKNYLTDFEENDLKSFKLVYHMFPCSSYELRLYTNIKCEFIIDIGLTDFVKLAQ